MKRVWVAVLTACLAAVFAAGAGGEEKVRLILKSARQASVYYAFAVGQAGAIMEGAPDIEVTIEESPGSMVNVKESRIRENFVFTSPTTLISSARQGKGDFSEGGYEKIRRLWPLPGIIMHWVVREDSGINDLKELVGKRFIPGGAGSAGVKVTETVFDALGIKDNVTMVLIDLNEGVQAVKNDRAIGFATSSSVPAGMISEIAATMPIRLLGLDDWAYEKISGQYSRRVIPAGTYSGVDYDVNTIGQIVGAYATLDVSEDVVYKITRAFWENRPVWEKTHPAMKLIQLEDVNLLKAPVHPGALRYYREIGFEVKEYKE